MLDYLERLFFLYFDLDLGGEFMLYKDFINLLNTEYNLNNDILRDINWLISYYTASPMSIYIANDFHIADEIIPRLLDKISLLVNHTPLAYILGNVEFYGNTLNVSPDVLIPRPETELLCDYIIKNNPSFKHNANNSNFLDILDVCTGSGCIAITLAKNLHSHITATDISLPALTIAQANANHTNTNIQFIHSNMFDKVTGTYDIIVSNPPYIESSTITTLADSVKNFEPHLALDGGKDGLDFYKIISQSAPKFLKSNGQLYLEIGFNQAQAVTNLLSDNFENITVIKDYNGLDRIITATLRSKQND